MGAAAILCRKWSFHILRLLYAPRTFSEIRKGLGLITNRTLSQELRRLHEEGYILIAGHEYLLSEKGREFLVVAQPFFEWMRRNS